MGGKPYTLLTAATPNGWKASITLEELGFPYEITAIDLGSNEQKKPEFLKINPNGRVPALVDHTAGDLPVFESGAIMWYLATKDPEHRLWPKDFAAQTNVMCWLMFQMGGVGPMQGQANHFRRYAPSRIEYALNRYQNETRRLYQVMDSQLADHDWLAADMYSIADIACFSWVYEHAWSGVEIEDLPHLHKWFKRIEARPAVQRGLNIPEPNPMSKMLSEAEAQELIDDARKYMVSTEKQ